MKIRKSFLEKINYDMDKLPIEFIDYLKDSVVWDNVDYSLGENLHYPNISVIYKEARSYKYDDPERDYYFKASYYSENNELLFIFQGKTGISEFYIDEIIPYGK